MQEKMILLLLCTFPGCPWQVIKSLTCNSCKMYISLSLLFTRLWIEPCFIWITPTTSPMLAAWALSARPTCLPTQPSVALEAPKEWWLLSAGWVILLRSVAYHLRRYRSPDTFQDSAAFEQALRTGKKHRKLWSIRIFCFIFCWILSRNSGFLFDSHIIAWFFLLASSASLYSLSSLNCVIPVLTVGIQKNPKGTKHLNLINNMLTLSLESSQL